MPDEWSTLNLRRDKPPSRELEVVRRRYIDHRQTLARLASDAPTEHLAAEYARLVREIDAAIAKLDELDHVATVPTGELDLKASSHPAQTSRESRKTRTGNLPIEQESSLRARAFLIVGIGFAVLATIVFVLWRYLSAPSDVLDQTTAAPAVAQAPPTPVITPEPVLLGIEPPTYDYGVVRKGTRETHKFQIINTGASAIPLAVGRSECKCLWFQYPQIVPARGSVSLTVTIDGGRAKKGKVDETIRIASKEDQAVSASLDLSASVE